jgi:hypothetical protein
MLIHIQDLSQRIIGKTVRTAYRALRAHPDSSPYISGDAFRALADHVLDMDGVIDPRTVRRGDVVFVATHELPVFEAEILSHINESFILITHNSDWNIDENRVGLAENPRIAKWFAQNVMTHHPKLVHIPIGLENRWRHNNGIVADFDRLAVQKISKKPRILYAFSVGTNREEREPALASLRRAKAADEYEWTNSRAYRRVLHRYCFVASPPGNGVDCHRTWEALYLGVIPIVKRSILYEGFPNLPVFMVDDWSEIEGLGEVELAQIYERKMAANNSMECLWMDYWKAQIKKDSRDVVHLPAEV